MSSKSIVELAGVRKVYFLGATEVPALRGVTFAIEKGDFISIAGPSGSGKTTILNLIGAWIRRRKARSALTAWKRAASRNGRSPPSATG